MNKFSKLLTGAFAIALCACSSEEPIVEGGGNQIPAGPTGDTAYFAIDLCDANTLGRGTDGGFEYGEADEQAVSNAYFYFYDKDGRFVSEASLWKGGNDNDADKENVEFFGNNTIILNGLTGKSFPTYVVTVLNKPAKMADGVTDFTPGATLAEMGQIILDSYKSGSNFIMTTTSWRGDADDHEDDYYFATKLQEKNFFNEMPTKEDITADRRAEIYVERLAVKVRVKLASSFVNTSKTVGGKTIYKLTMTAAGSGNTGDGSGIEADTDLWVSFEGWGLNSVAKNTYLMKNLEGLTSSSVVGGWPTWNQPSLHRSFWGKATTYGLADDALKAAMNPSITYAGLVNELGDADYCNENTNTAANITNDGTTLVIPAKTTSVLLKAVVCDGNGNPLDIVTYQGLTFLKSRFIAYIMQAVNPQYFTRTLVAGQDPSTATDANYNYTPITVDDVTLAAAGHGTGSVNVALSEEAATKTWYTVTMGTGGVASATVVTADDINNRLASATPANNKAIAATTGATYYPIAIEHLNNPEGTTVAEAQYGVVRNHCYEIVIKEVKALGNGVFKPGIIPGETEPLDPVDPKNPKYYVGARINILSWKIVNQEVTLD